MSALRCVTVSHDSLTDHDENQLVEEGAHDTLVPNNNLTLPIPDQASDEEDTPKLESKTDESMMQPDDTIANETLDEQSVSEEEKEDETKVVASNDLMPSGADQDLGESDPLEQAELQSETALSSQSNVDDTRSDPPQRMVTNELVVDGEVTETPSKQAPTSAKDVHLTLELDTASPEQSPGMDNKEPEEVDNDLLQDLASMQDTGREPEEDDVQNELQSGRKSLGVDSSSPIASQHDQECIQNRIAVYIESVKQNE